jgi:ribosome-binding protein aMBF1 (putative translation factor)
METTTIEHPKCELCGAPATLKITNKMNNAVSYGCDKCTKQKLKDWKGQTLELSEKISPNQTGIFGKLLKPFVNAALKQFVEVEKL